MVKDVKQEDLEQEYLEQLEQSGIKVAEEDYFFPEFQVTIKASSLKEAQEKLKEKTAQKIKK